MKTLQHSVIPMPANEQHPNASFNATSNFTYMQAFRTSSAELFDFDLIGKIALHCSLKWSSNYKVLPRLSALDN